MAVVTMPEAVAEQVVRITAESASDGPLTEIIDGVVTEMPPMGTYPNEVSTLIATFLNAYVRDRGIGRVIAEALFRLDDETQYRPDIAYLSVQTWPKGRRTPDVEGWAIIPDLAIEVVSRTDKAWDVLIKVHRYLEAGAKQAWLVYPNLEVIHVYESTSQIRVFARQDTLEVESLIPGLRMPLASIFEEEEEQPTP